VTNITYIFETSPNTKPNKKKVWGTWHIISPHLKEWGTRPPCPSPNCAHVGAGKNLPGVLKSVNGLLSGPAKHAVQAILYQAHCTILRVSYHLCSFHFLIFSGCAALTRVDLCRSLHWILFQSSSVVRLGNAAETSALLALVA